MNDLTPFTAVTAADPYRYYRRLVAERPLAFDARIDAWVAAGAAEVEAALLHRALHVRPASEPVPKAMVGTVLGTAFARFARMNDGAAHEHLRQVAAESANTWDLAKLETVARENAERCAARIGSSAVRLNAFPYDMPAMTVATMLGIDDCPHARSWIGDFARAIRPDARPIDIEHGVIAAEALHEALGRRMTEDDIASSLGFLFQTYDATAGLIANVFAAAAAANTGCDGVALDLLIENAVRYDAPVHSTRRFAVDDVGISNETIRTGQLVIVLLAAANRDPLGNRSYTFGLGAHACLGAQIAVTIARAGLRSLIEHIPDLSRITVAGYQPSLTCRTPIFETGEAAR